jgi:hypothetical protein
VAAARDDLSSAAACYRETLALAEELEMRPFVAHCHWGLARVLRRTGQLAAVESHYQTADALFGSMDMQYWREHLAADRAQPD